MEKTTIQQHIADLESTTADTIPAEQVRSLITAVKDLFEGRFESEDVKLYGELGDLAKFINGAKKELRDFQPHVLSDQDIPDASNQLDAIVQQTEKATGSIMDSCEQLEGINQRIIDKLISHDPQLDEDVLASVDDAMVEAQNHVTNIFESCNFQDLTGQRIMKIVKTLKEVERQVLRMVVVFGLQNTNVEDSDREKLKTEAELLDGPQLPGNSLEQDDIDDILNKLL
ncbi:MAG: chemotaxis protein CheZ [Alphaproteobacteria bacterium]|jgi:chemotaxis protein CheZ